MSLLAVTDVTLASLQLLLLVSVVWSRNQCTTRMPNPIHGQMYTGSIYAVVSNIGPQKCVSECISRKPYCQGVNYSRNRLSCEIFSSTEYSISSEEYMRVDLVEVKFVLRIRIFTEQLYFDCQNYKLHFRSVYKETDFLTPLKGTILKICACSTFLCLRKAHAIMQFIVN
jgi:hypothetical protein